MRREHLSNLQKEILKIYSTDLKKEELLELKKLLSVYYAKKAISGADRVWQEKKLTDKDMEKWLNEEQA